MAGWAVVDLRRNNLYVCSYSRAGLSNVINGWVQTAPGSVPDSTVGQLARAALSVSREDAPFPDFRNDPIPELRKLLDLAGAKSYGQYVRGTRSVRVALDDIEPGFVITPFRNQGRDGFTPMTEQRSNLAASTDDADLGIAIRAALELAT
jgi:hypothetical protein